MKQAISYNDYFYFDTQQQNLKNRLSYELDQKEFFKKIDAIPELIGAGVIYTNGVTAVKLREFKPICFINPVYVILQEAPPIYKKAQLKSHLEATPRNSHLAAEIVGATLSCGSAFFSWIVIA